MKQRVEEKDLCKYSKSNKEMKRKVRMGRRGSRLVRGKYKHTENNACLENHIILE